MNNKPKQFEAKLIGKDGCYFLSIIYGCCAYKETKTGVELNVDIIKAYEKAVESGWIDDDCYVNDSGAIASYILGEKVIGTKQPLSYETKDNEIEITRYQKEDTGVTFSHFVITRNGEVVYDPYGNSSTVSKGYPVSKRILTVG